MHRPIQRNLGRDSLQFEDDFLMVKSWDLVIGKMPSGLSDPHLVEAFKKWS